MSADLHLPDSFTTSTMNLHYILKGREIVTCDMMTWAMFLEHAERHVAESRVKGCYVSTVFLGLDHNFRGGGAPLLFESMTFGGGVEEVQWRYATWDEAAEGHRKICEYVRRNTTWRSRIHFGRKRAVARFKNQLYWHKHFAKEGFMPWMQYVFGKPGANEVIGGGIVFGSFVLLLWITHT